MWGTIFGLIGLGVLGVLLWELGQKKLIAKIAEKAIVRHLPSLSRKYDQLTYRDDYGKWVFGDWEREKKYFIQNVLAPEVPLLTPVKQDSSGWFALEEAIDHAIDLYQERHGSSCSMMI
jgi:hypothetical protein